MNSAALQLLDYQFDVSCMKKSIKIVAQYYFLVASYA